MSSANVVVRMSRHEIDYLSSAAFLTSNQIDTIRSAERSEDGSASVTISRDHAEEFRDAFTFQLGKVGFDGKYEVTSEGRILEALIDRFFTG